MKMTMKKSALAAGVAVLLTAGAATIAAERTPLDTNNDGAIDFAEMQARRSDLTPEQFNAMDKDGNGQLTREEMRTAGRERMQARADERFKALDTDKDGGLSQAEIAAGRQQSADERFKKMDTDGDGKLTQAEMSAAREHAGQAFRDRGPGRHRGPPPDRN